MELVELNKREYAKAKDDNTKIQYEEDPPELKSYGYYLISVEWMGNWRGFVHGKAEVPGEIDNSYLVSKIKKARKVYNYPKTDDDLGLRDRHDFYILSVRFFKFFYDLYGCSHPI